MEIQDYIEKIKQEGYVILENIFSESECQKVIDCAHNILGDNKDLTPLLNIHKSSEIIHEFMSQRKLTNFIDAYFDSRAIGLQTEFFFMPPKTVGFNPHQDNSYVKADAESFVSAWIALTDVNSNNGGLILWPRSHENGILKSLSTGKSKAKDQDPNATLRETIIPEKYKPVSFDIKKGSVLMLHSEVVHASHNNNSPMNRHVLLCTYINGKTNFRKGKYANREAFNLKD